MNNKAWIDVVAAYCPMCGFLMQRLEPEFLCANEKCRKHLTRFQIEFTMRECRSTVLN